MHSSNSRLTSILSHDYSRFKENVVQSIALSKDTTIEIMRKRVNVNHQPCFTPNDYRCKKNRRSSLPYHLRLESDRCMTARTS